MNFSVFCGWTTKVSLWVAICAVLNYLLIFLVRGGVLLLLFPLTFLFRMAVAVCFFFLALKITIVVFGDIFYMDWRIMSGQLPIDRQQFLIDVLILIGLLAAAFFQYRAGYK